MMLGSTNESRPMSIASNIQPMPDTPSSFVWKRLNPNSPPVRAYFDGVPFTARPPACGMKNAECRISYLRTMAPPGQSRDTKPILGITYSALSEYHDLRSEERRVGKEGRGRRSADRWQKPH